MIGNFLFCIERFGFVPNGNRKYYLDRSQPPLLSTLMRSYYHVTKDLDFIRTALPVLEREHVYWMSQTNGHAVQLTYPDPVTGEPKTGILNRYYSLGTTPRPESYRLDVITGTLHKRFHGCTESAEEHWRAIRAGAESGWDFSSRWLRPAVEGKGEEGIRPDEAIEGDKVLHKVCLIDIDTCTIIPCDLNAYLYCLEEDLAFFAEELNAEDSIKEYNAAKECRREIMQHFLWDKEKEMWLDYDMVNQKLSQVISAASYVPLWAGVNPEGHAMTDERRLQLAENLSCLTRPYGIVCTNVFAGLQWDMPNVWAPNHHIAYSFLCGGRFWELNKTAESDRGPAMKMGINWASRFVNTVLARYELYGTVSEKYHCSVLAKSGVDGEYQTQTGFGWSNGVVLDALKHFGPYLTPIGFHN